VTAGELRARRAAAQRLHRPDGADAAAVVRGLLAVQAQDDRAARLAVRARTTGLRATDVDAALTADRALVVGWLMRVTLHLVAREDYAWLLGLTAPQGEATGRRRLAQEGVTPGETERAVAVVERALAADGPLTRMQLGARIRAAGVRAEGQALPHLLAVAARRGIVVRGPVDDGDQRFVLAREWLGARPVVPLAGEARDAALAELARRYLGGHGPASAGDLASWSGLALRDARRGLEAIAPELSALPGAAGLVDLAARSAGGGGGPAAAALAPRLLPAFDPYLLGWKERAFAVPARHARRVHPGGGMLRAVATADGRAVATWSARRRDGRLAVTVEPFGRIPARARAALDAEAADVARFEGLEAVSPPPVGPPGREARRRRPGAS
jgi:winged helix DNA-binding protein